jgi:hypothetical protein
MRLFPLLDAALLSEETRTAYATRTPRVWPSEASAVLFDQRESDIIGGCHRKSYWRLIGEPQTNKVDVIGARRFRTGRAMELDIISLAKTAGVFVACGVRYHVADIDLPLELDLVVVDLATKALYIVENKTIYGWASNKMVIRDGHPKLEGVMQSVIYLNEFGNGAKLKRIIRESWSRKQELAAKMAQFQEDGVVDGREYWELKKEFDRNRIEVDFENLDKGADGLVGVKMTYETRDDCQTREFDIGLSQDPLDGLHYPEIDSIPQKLFTVESIYERYRILQEYYLRNVAMVREQMQQAGWPEPPCGGALSAVELSAAVKAYWDEVFKRVRALHPSYWPPAEYQWKYGNDKIQVLGEAGIIGKTRYRDWQKRVKGKTHVGAWQCAYCPHKAKCIAVEYPEYTHLIADMISIDGEQEAA